MNIDLLVVWYEKKCVKKHLATYGSLAYMTVSILATNFIKTKPKS